MSVRGLGIDIVEVERIADLLAKHGDRFVDRCFRPGEQDHPTTGGSEVPEAKSIAARWAAKEAFLKALGTDVRDIPYRDIEVVRSAEGPVSLNLHGRALDALKRSGTSKIHLSLSHERHYAVASVLLEE